MSYLYGDSTPSTLEINYIEFLRDAVEFCVQVLLADQRVLQARVRTRSLDHTTASEIDRLQQLHATVTKAVEGTPWGTDSAAARCAATIVRAAGDLVRAEVSTVQSALAAENGKRDAEAVRERDGCVRALEVLLSRHDLPGMTLDVHLGIQGARYACRALMATGFGLGAVLDLEVPANHLFSQVVRVERLAERLEVHAPEMSGWVKKEMKLRSQHLEKHHVTEVSILDGSGAFKLRLAPEGTGPGFDVMVASEGPRPVRLVRIDEQGAEAGPPFEAQNDDGAKLLAFYQKLAGALNEVTRHRRRVVEATVDGESMRTFDNPSVLVERLVATIAPVVREIAARSRSTDEFVLRRLLGDDRREEIFVSKDELRRKLEPLVDGRRALFDPLWRDGSAPAVPAPLAITTPGSASAPAPTPAPPASPGLRASLATAGRVDRSTPRAGSMVVGSIRVPSPVTGIPVAPASANMEPTLVVKSPLEAASAPTAVEPAATDTARTRVGTPLWGSPSADMASASSAPPPAAPPAPAAAPAPTENAPRRPFGSPAFPARTQTPAVGSGPGTSAPSPAADPARGQPLLRRFGTPSIGSPAPPSVAPASTSPAVSVSVSSPAPTNVDPLRSAETPRRPFLISSLRGPAQIPVQPAASDPGPTPIVMHAEPAETPEDEDATPPPEPSKKNVEPEPSADS